MRSSQTPQWLAVFGRQYGVASDRQLRAAGVSLKRQIALLAAGELQRVWPGVLRLVGAPTSWEQKVMAAVLVVPGAVAMAATAACLHGFDGYQRQSIIEVLVPRSARIRQLPGITFIRRDFGAKDRYVVRGIPVTTVPVTLIHLAGAGHPIEQAMDSVLRDGAHPTWLRDTFVRWQRGGMAGPTQCLKALHERVGARLPLSWFQSLAKAIFVAEGIMLVDEFPVIDEKGRTIAIPDLADVDLKIGIECQSWEWHGSPSARYRDALRKRKLRLMGWTLVEVWWSDLDRAESVLEQVRLEIATARERLARSV